MSAFNVPSRVMGWLEGPRGAVPSACCTHGQSAAALALGAAEAPCHLGGPCAGHSPRQPPPTSISKGVFLVQEMQDG